MTSVRHIAVVCPRFADGATVGGAETLLRRLADRIAASGRQVTFLTTCAQNHHTWENNLPPGQKKVGALDVIYFPVDENRDISTFLRVQESISNRGAVTREDEEIWIKNSVNSQALCDHLKTQGNAYDCIIMGPYLFGLVFHAAQIFPDRTFLAPCLHDEPFAWLSIMKDLFGSVRGFLFNTEPERELARRLFGTPDERSAVVGMGLDVFDAHPESFGHKYGMTAPYVLYSGRREPLKGTPLLLDYMDAFRARTGRDVNVVLTGSGAYDVSPELAPHVLDVGFVSEQEKHEAMAGALAFIHPSVNESLGIVLLEAWLARTPALVHARGEVLRWQCARSGAGVWFRHYPDFETALLRLMDDPPLRARMGEAGRAYVEREYAWSAVEARLWAALEILHQDR
jgi:glycosyltransferase involved in cell wall biosynthesis